MITFVVLVVVLVILWALARGSNGSGPLVSLLVGFGIFLGWLLFVAAPMLFKIDWAALLRIISA